VRDPDYGDDLAYVHDAGFGDFARRAAPGLVRMLRGAGISGGLVVDLGCGSGIWAAALVRSGYDVLGLDPSPAMLALARERAPAARFVQVAALDAELPACAAITALGEVLSYQADARAGREATRALFARMYAALRPGGVLVFDVVGPGREQSTPPRRTWSEGEDWTVCVEVSQASGDGVLTRRIIVFRRFGDTYRRTDEEHRQWAYARDDVLADLAAAGFEARHLSHYGPGAPLPRGHDAYAAHKPA
jgi:SAM-dependent methyltransferase